MQVVVMDSRQQEVEGPAPETWADSVVAVPGFANTATPISGA